jgi:hypothetical protein
MQQLLNCQSTHSRAGGGVWTDAIGLQRTAASGRLLLLKRGALVSMNTLNECDHLQIKNMKAHHEVGGEVCCIFLLIESKCYK